VTEFNTGDTLDGPLRYRLSEWSDADVAEFHLAQVLGLFPDAPFMSAVKYVFWSSNPLGDALDDVLQRLVDVGVLEFRDDDDEGRQYRWKLEDEGHSLAEGRGR
jgi:hypothetical protein